MCESARLGSTCVDRRLSEGDTAMICTRCGSTEADDSVYCSSCGASLVPPAPSRSATTRPTSVATEAATAPQPEIAGRAQQKDPYQKDYERAKATGFPKPRQEAPGTESFLASLFDINFRSFVTPKIVKVVYVLIIIVLGLSAIGYAIFAFRLNAVFGIISLVILCPLYFFISLMLWRIVLEVFVVLFRIAEDLRTIRVLGVPRAPAAESSSSSTQPGAYRPATSRME